MVLYVRVGFQNDEKHQIELLRHPNFHLPVPVTSLLSSLLVVSELFSLFSSSESVPVQVVLARFYCFTPFSFCLGFLRCD